ncbi:unnamed protein product [Vitrella brassicaformis CCMP3155]|uniref:Uncharacterized protein n=1 Tax=Vitrella brassicaformis (strain CCMP3155) TaxID=1169540 RepID=A0A0G4GCU9_VITBC|nr:unnamed protein product [Vitrella brassicaformis CCMP3155]|eukprot:CEM26628.1 unnamed protein product [Vitrella brassicaformis CCMP3155]
MQATDQTLKTCLHLAVKAGSADLAHLLSPSGPPSKPESESGGRRCTWRVSMGTRKLWSACYTLWRTWRPAMGLVARRFIWVAVRRIAKSFPFFCTRSHRSSMPPTSMSAPV